MKTVEDIVEQVERAMKTLHSLPPVGPSFSLTQWPDYIRDYWELWKQYGGESAYFDYDKRLKMKPTPEQIDELDEVLGWHTLIPKETYKIILARGCGMSWRKIEAVAGKSYETCRERWRVGIVALSFYVSRKNNLTDLTKKPILESKIEALSL